MTDDILFDYFSEYGHVESAYCIKRHTGANTGYGFVYYSDEETADFVIGLKKHRFQGQNMIARRFKRKYSGGKKHRSTPSQQFRKGYAEGGRGYGREGLAVQSFGGPVDRPGYRLQGDRGAEKDLRGANGCCRGDRERGYRRKKEIFERGQRNFMEEKSPVDRKKSHRSKKRRTGGRRAAITRLRKIYESYLTHNLNVINMDALKLSRLGVIDENHDEGNLMMSRIRAKNWE